MLLTQVGTAEKRSCTLWPGSRSIGRLASAPDTYIPSLTPEGNTRKLVIFFILEGKYSSPVDESYYATFSRFRTESLPMM